MITPEIQQIIDGLETRLKIVENRQHTNVQLIPLLGTRVFGFNGSMSSLAIGSTSSFASFTFNNGVLVSSHII